MRKHKIYLGKRHHHKLVPRLLKPAALRAYAGEVEHYIKCLNDDQVLRAGRSTGKSAVITHLFSPVTYLNQLKEGQVPVRIGLLAVKLPTPAWGQAVKPPIDMDVCLMYANPVKLLKIQPPL